MILGSLVGCDAIFGTQQVIDIETPLPTEFQVPDKPETLSDIQTLIQNDNGTCQLPCFWSFRLEYSTEEEVLDFLQLQPEDLDEAELSYSFPESAELDSLFWLNFSLQNNLLSQIVIVIDNPSDWLPDNTLQLHHLLSMLPSTSEIYLSINTTTQKAFLTLAYDEGVLARYVFDLRTEGASTLEADYSFCTSLSANELIRLQLRNVDAQALLEGYGMLDESVQNKVWTIDRMTGMSVEDFVTHVIDNPDGCIDIYSYAELSEMGYEGF
jgi:hypothetical protein